MDRRSIVQGTSRAYNLTFKTLSTGVAIDITNYTLYFTMKRNLDDADADAVISKTITSHSDPANGISTFSLTAAETALLEPGDYFFDIQIKPSTGLVYSISRGIFTVLWRTTQRSAV